MATPPKDTIYIDVDDEITGIIDKLRSSEAKIVALVLPKRASVFQSIVNMKLLKRAADEDKKHLVLITTETGLLPLAGLAGVLVASSLTSKPAIPIAPVANDLEETVDEASGIVSTGEVDPELKGDTPIGELAGLPATAPLVDADGVETINMDDEVDAAETVAPAAAASPVVKKIKKDKKLEVPNFERFRLLLILGGLALIVLIVGIVFAVTVLPKATIAVTTNATNVNTNVSFTADTAAATFSPTANVLPAKAAQQQKVYTEQASATGQKNNGEKATGQVEVTNCGQDDIVIAAGTGISSNGLTFISQNAVIVPVSGFYTKKGVSTCQNDGHNSVNVRAQSGGANYNLADQSKYTISGQDSKTVTGVGTAMTGGTDNIVKIVSQTDIDSAKAKIAAADTGIKTALNAQLVQMGLYALDSTFSSSEPKVVTSATAGDPADNVTVTETVSYTMLGVQQADLKTILDDNIKKQIDTGKQSILDEGLRGATFAATGTTATSSQINLQSLAVAGPQLSVAMIKTLAAGKKSGDVQSELRADPGVTDVTVKFSPFFVNHVPKKLDKITVTIAKPTVTVKANANGTNP